MLYLCWFVLPVRVHISGYGPILVLWMGSMSSRKGRTRTRAIYKAYVQAHALYMPDVSKHAGYNTSHFFMRNIYPYSILGFLLFVRMSFFLLDLFRDSRVMVQARRCSLPSDAGGWAQGKGGGASWVPIWSAGYPDVMPYKNMLKNAGCFKTLKSWNMHRGKFHASTHPDLRKSPNKQNHIC